MGMRDSVVAGISQILRSMIILWLLLGAACGGQGTNVPGTNSIRTARREDRAPRINHRFSKPETRKNLLNSSQPEAIYNARQNLVSQAIEARRRSRP